jgi:SulP family sulfate permease
VAIGLCNLVGSFFGVFPSCGSLTRSSVNDKAGGKTPVSALVSALLTLLTILYLLPAFKYMPTVVMAAIIGNNLR